MNLFDDDEQKIRSVILYFNALSDEIKARIVSNLHPQEFQPKEHFDSLLPLLSKIQIYISKYNGMTITNRLIELGLEETYAMLIVNNMKKQAPTLEYQLSQLSTIDDGTFENNIEKIINAIWIDKIESNRIIEKYGIDHEQYDAIYKISADMILGILRNDTTEKNTSITFTKHGLSQRKTEAFLKSVEPHLTTWYSGAVFRHVQDTLNKVSDLEAQNIEIMKNMKSMLDLLKKLGTRLDLTYDLQQ